METLDGARGELWRRRLTIPFYKSSEAARFSRSTPETVARWNRLGVLPGREPRLELSYLELVEFAVAAAMRKAGVPLKEVKKARDFFAQKLQTEFPFATKRFRADGKKIVLDYGEIEPAAGLDKVIYSDGQLGWKEVVDRLLKEFEYDGEGLAIRWKVGGLDSAVVIDPQISFGSPNVGGAATWVLRDRYLGGESVGDLEDDFDLDEKQILDALKFENIPEVDLGRPKLWMN